MKALREIIVISLMALALPVMGSGTLAGAVETGAASIDEGQRGAFMQAKEAYGRLPLSFEANQGQADEQVRFLCRGAGYNLFLTRDESVLVLRKDSAKESGSSRQPHLRHAPPKFEIPSIVRMKILDANPEPVIQGKSELPGKVNYLSRRDPSKWRTDVAQFERVEYGEIYPGVNLVYYGKGIGKDIRLEHDFVVQPGSDPGRIKLSFDGVEGMELNSAGDLVLRLSAGGELIQHAPVIYQESEGSRKQVNGGYVLLSASSEGASELPRVGFQIAEYDRNKTLYIDPLMSYSTYLGGSDYDFGFGIAVDSANCAYITGWTYSVDFPIKSVLQSTNAGGADVFVTKLNALGTATVYSTFVGGSGNDFGSAITVDGAGAAYVTGYTDSTDFPTTAGVISTANAGLHDAFVFKVNAAGSALTYSTYLGGTDEDYATGIAVRSGVAYVTGYTASTDFPVAGTPYQGTLAGLNDAFFATINSTGTVLTYSTFIGGSDEDYATSIVVDSAGLAYIAGYTKSTDYPTSSNAYQAANAGGWDAFISVGNSTGFTYSSYLGGTGDDFAYGVAAKADSIAPNDICAYITGSTSSSDYPVATSSGTAYQTTIAGNYDAFVSKVDPTLLTGTLIYSTYLGGEDYDTGNAIIVDSSNNAYIAGETWSQSFPVKGSPFQGVIGGLCDSFLTKLNSTGTALSYSTYLGGADYDSAMAIALDSAGGVYLTGYTYSTDFPVALPLSGHSAGYSDAFVTKITTSTPPLPDLVVSSIATPTYGLVGQKITVSNSVMNQAIGVAAPCKLSLYLSQTVTSTPWTDSRSVFLGSRSVPSLKYLASSSAATSVLISPNVTPGTYYIVAVADSGKVVEESDETNNTRSRQIKVYGPRPDLYAISVSCVATAKVGQTISVSSSVKNQGYGTARNFSVGIYLSTDATITNADTLIGSRMITTLAPGVINSSFLSVQIPVNLTPGTYYIGMIADDGSNVVELFENNNARAGNRITVSP